MFRIEFNNKTDYSFEWHQDQSLLLCQDGKKVRVKPISNFPWSHPDSFISICNSEGDELLQIENLDLLDGDSKTAVEEALKNVRFILEIKKIISVSEESDLRVWQVKTQIGPRKIVTKLDAWPTALNDDRVLVTDISGDLYEVRNIESMDKRSQQLLWALVDWE